LAEGDAVMTANEVTPGMFQGTAAHYATYRPGIPDEVVTYVRDLFELDGRSTLLDMGCGTGLSTLAFAPLFARTVAFDSDAAMLTEARARTPEGVHIEWQHRSDQDVTPDEGPYRLALACRSLHWMDQPRLLDTLHHILEPGGGIAIIGDGSFWTGTDPWQATVREVIQGFLGADRRAGDTSYRPPNEPYPALLARTGYTDIRFKEIPISRTWNVEHILGYLYSTSFSAQHLYAGRLTEFEDTLRSKLLESSGGTNRFVEHATFGIHTGVHHQ
jgi:SAM-dependent methyltransferase